MCRKDKKRIRLVLIWFLLIFPLLLTGCWNNRDLVDINIAAGIGLDRTEEGKVLLTVQMVEPAAIQSTSSGKGKDGGNQLKSVIIRTYEGDTVFEAVREMLSIVDKKVFFSTAQVLILGERLLQDGMEEVLDFFQRDHEIDYEIRILVANGVTPREILEMENDMDSIPAVYIKKTIDNNIARGTVRKTMLIDLIKDIECNGRQPAIGQISKAEENQLKTEGIAVIKDGKLAGWLDPYETRGFLFAKGEVRSTIVSVPGDNGKIAMEIMRTKAKIKVELENNRPSMLSVKVDVEANVGGYEGRGRLELPEDLYMLDKMLEDEIKKEIMMALEKTQKEYSSDIFGFGTYVHRHHPKCWKNVEKEWDDIFSELPAHIQVDAKIMRTGIITNPLTKGE